MSKKLPDLFNMHLPTVGILIAMLIIGFGHYLIHNVTSVVLIFALLSFIGTYLLMSSIKNTSWEAIKNKYAEGMN
jgi:putative Mn2+ efflux pump MntP